MGDNDKLNATTARLIDVKANNWAKAILASAELAPIGKFVTGEHPWFDHPTMSRAEQEAAFSELRAEMAAADPMIRMALECPPVKLVP